MDTSGFEKLRDSLANYQDKIWCDFSAYELKQCLRAAVARRSICAQFPAANKLIKQKCESCGH